MFPDARMLTDTVTIQIQTSEDRYQKPVYSDATISVVKFDRQNIVSGKGNSQIIVATGIVFVYPKFAVIDGAITFDDSLLNSKIVIDDHSYTISTFKPLHEAFSADIFCYEIGVI